MSMPDGEAPQPASDDTLPLPRITAMRPAPSPADDSTVVMPVIAVDGASDVATEAPSVAPEAPEAAPEAPEAAEATSEVADAAPEVAEGAPEVAEGAPEVAEAADEQPSGAASASAPAERRSRPDRRHRADRRQPARDDAASDVAEKQGARPTSATGDHASYGSHQGERGHHTEQPMRARVLASLSPRVTRGKLLAGVLCGLLGFAIVVQARQTAEEGLGSLRQNELVVILDNVTSKNERLQARATQLQGTLEQLRSGTDRTATAEETARERVQVLGILAGTLKATGPGITLSITDPDGQVGAAVLIDAVQELRDAGAEAMQVNDVRIVADTYFIDSATGVRVGDQTVTAPYTFTVIGDSQTLGAALEIPGGVLEVLRQRGATGTAEQRSAVTVDAVRPLTPAEFAEPAPALS